MKTICIVHYNTPELTEKAILSVRKWCLEDIRVIVFDNSDARPFKRRLDKTTFGTVKVIDNDKEFVDVAEGAWYAEAVEFASSHDLFKGVGDDKFAPAAPMTRAMLATVLYRLEDAAATGTNPFDDVADGTWYTDAVTWANEEGIVMGTGKGFDPNANITREQIATMLYRYAKYLGLDVGGSAALDQFSDGGETASWAKDAMQWAVSAGLFEGSANGRLNPQGDATRAEVAALLMRMVKLIVK